MCDLEAGQMTTTTTASTHPYSKLQSPPRKKERANAGTEEEEEEIPARQIHYARDKKHACTVGVVLLWTVISLFVVLPIATMLVYVTVCTTVLADADGVSRCFWNSHSANGWNASNTGIADVNNAGNVTV